MELLNIVGKGDISKDNFEGICDLFVQCSRGLARNRSGIRSVKGSSGGVTKVEVGNLLDNLKTDILSTLSTQMVTLQVKQKQLELDRTMAIFCPKCKKNHLEREFPLNSIEKCDICELNHVTSSFPSLSGLKVVFEGVGEDTEKLYLMGARKSWQLRPPMRNQGMYPDPSQYFNSYNMNAQTMPCPPMWPQYQYPLWQQWNPQDSVTSPWAPTC